MAKLPESKARRLQGLNQDVLAVTAPVPEPDAEPLLLHPQGKKQKTVRVTESGRSGIVWLSLGLAILALLLAASQWLASQKTNRELSELRQQYYQLASEHSQEADAGERTRQPATALRPGAVESLREDLRQLSTRVRGLTVSMAKMGNDDSVHKLEKRLNELDTSMKTLSSRVTTLANRPVPKASAPAAPAPKAANNEELSALESKVTKIDKDLQALYRILQGG
ncbi:MAG: hypothetical protein MI745_16655 [Pseudomonadales bacterium]|nr:hypothetical protein [Pseudomonadales bacterium]